MNDTNIFERATRCNLQFPSPRGLLTISDLWGLPLTSTVGKPNLNDIAKDLHRLINENKNPDFVASAKPSVDTSAKQLAFDVVLHIIKTREAENAIAADTARRAEQKQKIMALLAERQDESLKAKSEDELKALLATL